MSNVVEYTRVVGGKVVFAVSQSVILCDFFFLAHRTFFLMRYLAISSNNAICLINSTII